MFTGLSAFPLTPITGERVDERAFAGLIERLADAGVDSITALGSTGSYAYLSREERAAVARLAVRGAGAVPVMAGIGALRTRHVLEAAEDAQNAGVAAVLLAPLSYQALTEEDVVGLYETVTANLSVPLVVYDNPGTTHFTFTDELYARIAGLPRVASIKIPGVPAKRDEAAARIARLRASLPAGVTVGVSGDALASTGLNAGCQAWYSVIGGTLPQVALEITRAAERGEPGAATEASQRLQPLWDLFARHGSLRVISAIAELLGLVGRPNLPLPIRGLGDAARSEVAGVVDRLRLR
ncbi:dihydrodipicolinate synthase family protein [Amycolatopsis minnesotensis]|uniref:Dihydrodipicolinate synthase family protein n=1 Tax=Amycolatopsis minnesotensis TaxID=337894 RepID=A0ABN2QV93_9PSEU